MHAYLSYILWCCSVLCVECITVPGPRGSEEVVSLREEMRKANVDLTPAGYTTLMTAYSQVRVTIAL
jgi:hypothetical protein